MAVKKTKVDEVVVPEETPAPTATEVRVVADKGVTMRGKLVAHGIRVTFSSQGDAWVSPDIAEVLRVHEAGTVTVTDETRPVTQVSA